MSIITCPNCGKRISNTIKKCIHCNTFLDNYSSEGKLELQPKQESSTVKYYHSLSKSEADALEKEFCSSNKIFEKYKKWEKKQIRSFKFIVFTLFLSIIMLLLTNSIVSTNTYLSLAIIFVFLIIEIITLVKSVKLGKSLKTKQLAYTKAYQNWLLKKKQINMVMRFSEKNLKEKNLFESINLDHIDSYLS